MHQVEAFVDFVDVQGGRDQIVDVDLLLHVPIDDLWDIGAPPRATESGTLPDAPGHQLKWARADLLPRYGDADNDADAPAAVAAFQCLAHRVHIADAFEAVIGAPLCQIDKIGDEIALNLLRIDEMRHAELFGERAAPRVDVDPDDHVGADHAAALYDIEPDAAQAEDDNARSRLDLGGVDDGPDPGRDAAADIADLVERRVVPNFRDRDLRQHGEVRERRGTHIVK